MSRPKTWLILLVLPLLFLSINIPSLRAEGAPPVFQGVITWHNSNLPVPNATIIIYDISNATRKTVTSDINGRYKITLRERHAYRLMILFSVDIAAM